MPFPMSVGLQAAAGGLNVQPALSESELRILADESNPKAHF